MTIQPKSPFVMENPYYFSRIIQITAPQEVFAAIQSQEYVRWFDILSPNIVHVHIDARYDIDEAWLALYELLSLECQLTSLGFISE